MGDDKTKFVVIAHLFTVDELKDSCRELNVRGYSKLKKQEIIDLLASNMTQEDVKAFMNSQGREKLESTIKDAAILLEGKKAGGERLSRLDLESDELVMGFSRGRWGSNFKAKLDALCSKDSKFDCDCTVAMAGGRCLHFWTAMVYLHGMGNITDEKNCYGSLASLASDIIQKTSKRLDLGKAGLKPPSPEKLDDLDLEGLLIKASTDSRLKRARDEFVPEGKHREGETDKKKPKMEIRYLARDHDPFLKIMANFIHLEENGERRESSMQVLLDEEQKLVAHENCMDFQMRMAPEGKLCKHILAVLLHANEDAAKRFAASFFKYKYDTTMPVREFDLEAEKVIDIEVTPDVTLASDDSMKESIMEMLITSDGGPISVDSIKANLGVEAGMIIKIMEKEGMITVNDEGCFLK